MRPSLSGLRRSLKIFAAPSLIFITIMALTIGLRNSSNKLIESDLQGATQETRYKIVNILQTRLEERMSHIRQLGNVISASRNITADQFEKYARFIMADAPEILAITLADAEGRPVWVTSDDPELTASIGGVMRDRAMASPMERARLRGEYAITDQFQIPPHGGAFATIAPYAAENGEKGFVIAVFGYARLVSALLWPQLFGDYAIELTQGNAEVYRSFLFSVDERRKSQGFEDVFLIGPQNAPQIWRVRVRDTGINKPIPAYFTSGAILFLGGTLACIVSFFVYNQQRRAAKFETDAWISRRRLASTGLSLAQIQENLNLILNNVNEAIILYDERWTPVQANVAFRNAFPAALSPDQLGPSAVEHHRIMGSLFRNENQYMALLNHMRESPERPHVDQLEMRGETPDAPGRIYQRVITSALRPDGSRRGYLALFHEITALRAAERMKEDFLSSVTHDLRTPLASIKGFAETFIRDPQMDAATRDEFSRIIRNEATRLEEMIEDLLDLRRMEEGRVEIAPAAYNLRGLMVELVRSLHPILEANDIDIEVRWSGDKGTAPFYGNAGKIGRALRNLVSNAIKYSPSGSSILIEGVESEDRIELSVSDEGPGIPAEDMPHVFEKFYRGRKQARRAPGAGLGLAIVKHIIESHGGTVRAENREHGGTVFRIVMPRAQDPALHLGAESDAAESATTA